jgi:E3 ubiquitin-protein ligase EDD1
LYLNRHVLKYILGRPIRWHDLAFYDAQMYESLRQLILDSRTSDEKDGEAALAEYDLVFR